VTRFGGYLLILTFVSEINLMTKLYAAATKFVRSEEGASLAEYGLLLALIAVVCIGGMTLLGGSINNMFSSLSNTI
jgi:pilus assembly protein Flp/PilA